MTTDTPWTNDQLRREHEAREAFEEARLHEKCSDTITTLERDLSECRAALAERQAALDELVACKDLKDRIDEAWDACSRLGTAPSLRAFDEREDYCRREPLAWSTARALATKEPPRIQQISEETMALARRAVEAQRNDKRTEAEIIRDGVKFVMGTEEPQPAAKEGT